MIGRTHNLLVSQVEALSLEQVCHEAAAIQWATVVETAARASATPTEKGARTKALATLAASSSPLDRYAAQLVARWDAAKD